MPANTAYRRRERAQQDKKPQNDAIVMAMTVQIILCMLLLLIAFIAKKTNEAKYAEVAAQYQIMVRDPASSKEVLEEFSEIGAGVRQLFSSLEQTIHSLTERFAGEAPRSAPDAEDAVSADASPAGQTEESSGLQYDYLAAASADLGAGGAFPVSTGGQDFRLLDAPDGSTFSPVALAGKAVPPVTGLITSAFSYREHPLSGDDDFHTGVDIAAEEGRAVLAALPGEVVETGESEIYGKYVILQHATNLRTFYAHCSEIIATPPAAVRQGERIAKVGQTGVATGPHLHFSVIVEGQFTDPCWILEDNIRLVD